MDAKFWDLKAIKIPEERIFHSSRALYAKSRNISGAHASTLKHYGKRKAAYLVI